MPDYDYSQHGAYFITVCCADRKRFFGEITDSGLKHRPMGEFAKEALVEMCRASHHIALDYYVVMPNHLHAILWLNPIDGAESERAKHGFAPTSNRAAYGTQPHSLQSFVQAFKSSVTRSARTENLWGARPLWQRNYFEHVIRDDGALNRIREYIINNPVSWHLDRENPVRVADNEFYKWLDSHCKPVGDA